MLIIKANVKKKRFQQNNLLLRLSILQDSPLLRMIYAADRTFFNLFRYNPHHYGGKL